MKTAPSKNRTLQKEQRVRKKRRRLMAGVTAVFVVAALLALPPALAAVRMFDAHGATENPATILLFLCFFSFPAVLLCSLLVAWIFYVLEHFRRAFWILLIPLINVAGAGIALAWLQIAYDGLLGGKP